MKEGNQRSNVKIHGYQPKTNPTGPPPAPKKTFLHREGKEVQIHAAEIPYGFEYGSAKVERFHSDSKKGWVIIGIKTPKTELQVYVTKTGKVRVFSKGEWTPPEKLSKSD